MHNLCQKKQSLYHNLILYNTLRDFKLLSRLLFQKKEYKHINNSKKLVKLKNVTYIIIAYLLIIKTNTFCPCMKVLQECNFYKKHYIN